MCVFLCANPTVHEWLDIPVAQAHRQALALKALCPNASLLNAATGTAHDDWAVVDSSIELPKLGVRCIYDRAVWRHTWRRSETKDQSSHLSEEWHHALDAFTKAWGRLLVLVGWRS